MCVLGGGGLRKSVSCRGKSICGRPWASSVKVKQETWSVWQKEGVERGSGASLDQAGESCWIQEPACLPSGAGKCGLPWVTQHRAQHTASSPAMRKKSKYATRRVKGSHLKSSSFQQQDPFPSVLVTFRQNELPPTLS